MLSISYSDSNNWPHHSQQGKPRIMTTTTGKSLIPRLKQGASMRQLMAAFALENAIATYSTTKNDNGISIPHKVVYGLQVLGAPIGFLVTMYPWRILKMRRRLLLTRATEILTVYTIIIIIVFLQRLHR
jgi:hypothetical protein